MFYRAARTQIQHHISKLLTPSTVNCILLWFSTVLPLYLSLTEHNDSSQTWKGQSPCYIFPISCSPSFCWVWFLEPLLSFILSALWNVLLHTRDLAWSPKHEKQGCWVACVGAGGGIWWRKKKASQMCSVSNRGCITWTFSVISGILF